MSNQNMNNYSIQNEFEVNIANQDEKASDLVKYVLVF